MSDSILDSVGVHKPTFSILVPRIQQWSNIGLGLWFWLSLHLFPTLNLLISLVGSFGLPPSSWCCVCMSSNSTSCPVLHLSTSGYQHSPGPFHHMILVATSRPFCSADEMPWLASCRDSHADCWFCSRVSVSPVPLQFFVQLFGR